MFTVSEIYIRFPKYVYGFRNICDVYRCRESPGGPPSVAGGTPAPGASCHAPVTAGGGLPGRLQKWAPPTSFFLSVTSVVPVPDGTETQEMCPRDFRSFNGFRNIPDSGSIFTVSEIYLRFPKYVYGFRIMFTVSEIYI
jgi:hypothetical protein